MSYSGKVVLGESVDKLLLQSQVESFNELAQANWKKYSNFFNSLEDRLIKSINDWASKFYEEWELVKVQWPIRVDEDDEGKLYVSGDKCHATPFEFKYVSYETHVAFILRFTDLSLEQGLEAFHNLEFEQVSFDIRVSYMDDSTSFDNELHKSKISEFIEFLKKNFEYFKDLLRDCAKETQRESTSYNHSVENMTERLHAAIDALKDLEKKEKIDEFLTACNGRVDFEIPRKLVLSSKNTAIAKSMRIYRVHANRKFVDVEIEELEFTQPVTYTMKMHKRVMVKTLFGFDLTKSETLKLIGNGL